MSDLTRVLEWLERRQGKKKRALQVCTLEEIAGRLYARLLTGERIEIQHPLAKGDHFLNTGVSWWVSLEVRPLTLFGLSVSPNDNCHGWASSLPPKTGLQSFLVAIF